MEERNRNYRPPHVRSKQLPYSDLRELLNKKREERGLEEHTEETRNRTSGPPPDPPSILRDTLRGDDPNIREKSYYNPNYGARNRGPFRNRGNGSSRGFPRKNRGSFSNNRPPRGKLQMCNIKIEFCTETGNRKCTVDHNVGGIGNVNEQREVFSGRRGFRGARRGRGNYREQHPQRGQYRQYSKYDKSSGECSSRINCENSPKPVAEYNEENWDDDDNANSNNLQETTISNDSKEATDNKEYEQDEYYNKEDYDESRNITNGGKNKDVEHDDGTVKHIDEQNEEICSECSGLQNENEKSMKVNLQKEIANESAENEGKSELSNKDESKNLKNAGDINKNCDSETIADNPNDCTDNLSQELSNEIKKLEI